MIENLRSSSSVSRYVGDHKPASYRGFVCWAEESCASFLCFNSVTFAEYCNLL